MLLIRGERELSSGDISSVHLQMEVCAYMKAVRDKVRCNDIAPGCYFSTASPYSVYVDMSV